jgi:hypothetical protein
MNPRRSSDFPNINQRRPRTCGKLEPGRIDFASRWCSDFPSVRSVRASAIHGKLLLAMLLLASVRCGNPHAILQFTAPATVMAASPFTITVAVMINGARDNVINSRMHFTSSDPAASLPSDYYFSSADAGSHSFTNAFTLMTPGKQTISADIFDASAIKGSATVSVLP